MRFLNASYIVFLKFLFCSIVIFCWTVATSTTDMLKRSVPSTCSCRFAEVWLLIGKTFNNNYNNRIRNHNELPDHFADNDNDRPPTSCPTEKKPLNKSGLYCWQLISALQVRVTGELASSCVNGRVYMYACMYVCSNDHCVVQSALTHLQQTVNINKCY